MALKGRIRVPSDKSISHRSVLFSALSDGVSHVANLLASDDVLCSIAAARAIGARVDVVEKEDGLCGTITGINAAQAPVSGRTFLDIDCGNSGTTTRLMLGMLAGLGVHARLFGDASLSKRPMERVMKPLREMGAHFHSDGGTLPIEVLENKGLHAIDYTCPQASAQVKSAILLAGLAANGTSSVVEPSKSRDHSERMLPAFGVPVKVDGLRVSVEGPARLHPCDVSVPADPSSATFVAVAAAAIPGSDVVIEQVALNPTRTGAFSVMKRMGVDVSFQNETTLGAEPVGDVHVHFSPGLIGTRVCAEEIPTLIDEIPILSVLAARALGETVFEGAGELRVKESDRFSAIRNGLCAFGVDSYEDGDELRITGSERRPPHTLRAHSTPLELTVFHDHRLAMTWYLAGLIFGRKIVLDDAGCVSVSWPCFYDDIGDLMQP